MAKSDSILSVLLDMANLADVTLDASFCGWVCPSGRLFLGGCSGLIRPEELAYEWQCAGPLRPYRNLMVTLKRLMLDVNTAYRSRGFGSPKDMETRRAHRDALAMLADTLNRAD